MDAIMRDWDTPYHQQMHGAQPQATHVSGHGMSGDQRSPAAEPWSLTEPGDRPTPDAHQARRVSDALAEMVSHARKDGGRKPHFTDDEIARTLGYAACVRYHQDVLNTHDRAPY